MEQSDLLIHLCEHLRKIGVRYFITGSQATIAFGEPRFTNDIDVVVDLNEKNCSPFCDGFPEPEYYLNRDTVHTEIKRRGMFNIIHPNSGLKIDVMIPSQESLDELRFKRSVTIPISEHCKAQFSSPEDIIVQKLRWHRMGGGERHLRDIEGIIKIRDDKLDRNYIEDQSAQLNIGDLWQQILKRVHQG